MSTQDKAIEALEYEVHSDTGWLSDAQDANLQVTYDKTIQFSGEGSIDLGQLVSIVLEIARYEMKE